MTDPHVLIVGSGSVGKRHARNLAALGCRVSCMSPREAGRQELAAETPIEGGYGTIESALESAGDLTGVVIASPPVYHVDQAVAAASTGLAVLMEKPLSPDMESARRLAAHVAGTGTPVLMGYTWRWWEPLRDVENLLARQAIGPMRHARFVMAAHLADWHPWKPLSDYFMSRRDLGGGALLEESHMIDIMHWLLGPPDAVSAQIDKLSDLQIDADDNVDMVLTYPDGLRVTMHLDLYARPHETAITFVGDGGSIRWSQVPNRVAVAHDAEASWDTTDYTCERNDMFVAVAREFVDVMGGKPVATCTLADGVRAMELIELARQSHRQRRTVSVRQEAARGA